MQALIHEHKQIVKWWIETRLSIDAPDMIIFI